MKSKHIRMHQALLVVTVLLLSAGRSKVLVAQEWGLEQMVTHAGSETIYHARPIDASLLNRWPRELENEFQRRAHSIISAQTRDVKAGVNTYFENEKRTYGFLMAHVLGGNAQQALAYLQAQDHQHDVWHRETAGIDYYACFTLKHQMRKYFYFGDLLHPEYREQMILGARRWTEQDPFRRPHFAYESSKEGWGPDAKNSWVDVRGTENLFLMRVTSIYLMAEETENEETASLYKQQILNYAKTLYRVGMGEWDSENYHGHSIAPLLNLYDFARDREVKAAAKACLDFMAAVGAVKYWRGGFNGPTKRDYNHAQPFGGSAANALWVWFGDHPTGKTDDWESDEVHQITSAYRPPLAVVRLARKQFSKPVEIFSAKPEYSATTSFRADSDRAYVETQYVGNSYLMGSLAQGTSVDGGDVNGFKLLVFDESQGAIALHAAPTNNPQYPGSPMYRTGIIAAENRVAQFENLALWLVKDGKSPWIWVIPDHIEVTRQGDVTFLSCDRTWVAIRTLNGTPLELSEELSESLSRDSKNRFANHQALAARGFGKSFSGLAIEVGERESHTDFAAFQDAVLAAELDVSKLEQGIVTYRSQDQKRLGFHWNDDPFQLGVWRNGTQRELVKTPLYESPVIDAAWQGGRLSVRAAGATFICEVDDAGGVTFSSGEIQESPVNE